METFKRDIFEQLGNLYYALAAERHFPSITSGELKMALRKDWLSPEKGEPRAIPEAAHLMSVAIDTLETERTPYEMAYATFEDFYRKHEEQFSYALKKQILETAETVMRVIPSEGGKDRCYARLKELVGLPVRETKV